MDLSKLFEQRLQKIDILKDFINLYGDRNEHIKEFKEFAAEVSTIKDLLQTCKTALENFQTHDKQVYVDIITRAQKQQMVSLNILEALDERSQNQENQPQDVKNEIVAEAFAVQDGNILREQNTNVRSMTPAQISCKIKPNETPVFSYSDYMKSPYTNKRLKPISLQFTDFDRVITPEEFNKVPPYMRGRDAIDDIQHFLEQTIIKSLTIKYALLPKRREAVQPTDVDIWNLYKSQESYFKGEKFITQGDICRLTNRQIDKKTNTRISILRHIKILREERKNSAVCYIWIGN